MSAPLQTALARRMLYASVCAYNITGDRDGAQPVPGADRVEPSGEGYSYSVVEAYQSEVGFAGPPASYTPRFFADGTHDIDAALVGLTGDGYALVALRGTVPVSLEGGDVMQWVEDWRRDAHIGPIPWRLGGTPVGKAERGFAHGALKLWPWIARQLADLKAQAPAGVLVTGHSKGGAMSYLIAGLIAAEWPELAGRIEVHAFAPGACIDAELAEAYAEAGLAARTTRYMAAYDIVPFLPLWSDANIWSAAHFSGWWHEGEWLALGAYVVSQTGAGYTAPGALVYFDADCAPVMAPDALDQALAAVVTALQNGRLDLIGTAHSITSSYAKCFPPVPPGPPPVQNMAST